MGAWLRNSVSQKRIYKLSFSAQMQAHSWEQLHGVLLPYEEDNTWLITDVYLGLLLPESERQVRMKRSIQWEACKVVFWVVGKRDSIRLSKWSRGLVYWLLFFIKKTRLLVMQLLDFAWDQYLALTWVSHCPSAEQILQLLLMPSPLFLCFYDSWQ
jgi:hypothetical protein